MNGGRGGVGNQPPENQDDDEALFKDWLFLIII
jgi:hypothetical protein